MNQFLMLVPQALCKVSHLPSFHSGPALVTLPTTLTSLPLGSPPRLPCKEKSPFLASPSIFLGFLSPWRLSSPNTLCNFHTYYAGCLLQKRSQALQGGQSCLLCPTLQNQVQGLACCRCLGYVFWMNKVAHSQSKCFMKVRGAL